MGSPKGGAGEVTTPSYPPYRIIIDAPLDAEPKVVDDGGLTGYLLEAILSRLAQTYSTVWTVEMEEEDT